VFGGQLGETKTLANARPVPIHAIVGDALRVWQQSSPYNAPEDFLFPSLKNNGTIPVWPDMILQKIIRPALERARPGEKGRVAYISPFARYESSVPRGRREGGSRVAGSRQFQGHIGHLYPQSRLKSDKHVTNWWRCCRGPEGVCEDQHPSAPLNSQRSPCRRIYCLIFIDLWWALQDSNLRLPPCEGGTLPLS
jgi:hypothetical protein